MQYILSAQLGKTGGPQPMTPPSNSSDTLAIKCPNGHISYFDRRKICTEYRNVYRSPRFDQLLLTCQAARCGEEMIVDVDCSAYKKR
jgi:hypothetical protein